MATSGGGRGLVNPGRRRTQVRELQVTPWRRGFGAVAGAAPCRVPMVEVHSCSRPAGRTCVVRPYLIRASGFDSRSPDTEYRVFPGNTRSRARGHLSKAARGALKRENGFCPSLPLSALPPGVFLKREGVCIGCRLLRWEASGLLWASFCKVSETTCNCFPISQPTPPPSGLNFEPLVVLMNNFAFLKFMTLGT